MYMSQQCSYYAKITYMNLKFLLDNQLENARTALIYSYT